MRKLKKLLMLAVIPTTILFNASFAFADTTTDKLQLMFDQVKNNPEFQNGQLYVDVKFITQSGLVLQWDSVTGSFVIGSGSTTIPTTPTTPIVNEPVVNNPVVNNPTEQTTQINILKDSIEYNGGTYYTVRDMIVKHNMSMNDISINLNQNKLVFIKTNKSLNINDKTNIIIKNGIPYIKESAFINCK